MRRLAPIIALLALLVAVPAAHAKQIVKVQVCGVDDCVTTKDPSIIAGLSDGGPPTVPPDSRREVLRLTSTIAERPGGKTMGTFTSQWVPSLGLLVAEDGTWMKLPGQAARALNGLGLQPFPAPRTSQPVKPPPPDDGAPTWLLIVGALALAGALLAAVLLAQRPPRRSLPT
jgi:hypothetical protein